MDFIWDIIDSIEAFFDTGLAALIGLGFVVVFVVFMYILLSYFDRRKK